MELVFGTSNHGLATAIARKLQAKILTTEIGNFDDGELRIRIRGPINPETSVIIQSISKPANDMLMELALLADTLKRAGCRYVIAAIPYFGYGRQDRRSYEYVPLSASLVAKILETSGVDRVITLDLHSAQLEGNFRIPVKNIDQSGLFVSRLSTSGDSGVDAASTVVVSPDAGGLLRARNLASALGAELAIINKTRAEDLSTIMGEIIGDVKGKRCVIVDDIVDTAGTLCSAARLLTEKGATKVEACVTHPVLSKDAVTKIQASLIEKIYISDSIFHKDLPAKFTIISAADVIAAEIMKI